MPDDRPGIRNTNGRLAFFQCFWPAASAFKPLYGRIGHLHVALAERETSPDLYGNLCDISLSKNCTRYEPEDLLISRYRTHRGTAWREPYYPFGGLAPR